MTPANSFFRHLIAVGLAIALLQEPSASQGSGNEPDRLTGNHLTGLRPKDGFVPNEATAERIAEAILLPIYGDEIELEKPFRITLSDGVWTVKGQLPSNYLGGVAEVRIRKQDGTILYVFHTS